MADAYATLLANSSLASGDAWTLLINPSGEGGAGIGQVVSNLLGSAITEIDQYDGDIVTEDITSVLEEITNTPGTIILDEMTVMVPEDGNSTGIIIETNIDGEANNA